MEVTSSTDNAVIQSYIVSYIGMGFSGLFFMLFAFEYRGSKKVPFVPVLVCIIVCVALIATAIVTSRDGVINRVNIVETARHAPVHFAVVLWTYILLIVGDVILSKYVTASADTTILKYVSIVVCTIFFPVFALIVNNLKLFPHYDVVPMFTSFANIVLVWYILNYRTPEWAAMGRHNAVETMNDAFLLINNQTVLMDLNRKAIECFPQLKKDYIGMKVAKIPEFPLFLLDNSLYDFTLDVPPNGKRHFMLIRSPLKTLSGRRVGTNIMLIDDTINYDITEVLRHKTMHDGLTSLLNRTAMFDMAGRDWTLSVRSKRNSCILMLDIDFFKGVNDTYGHLVGDNVLRTLSEILRNRLRATDISARYGGEEFVVWVPDTDIKGAFKLAEAIRQIVEKKEIVLDNGEVIHITVSVGIAELRSCYILAKSFEKMLSLADEALYFAKNNGRNQTAVCIPNDNGCLEFMTSLEQLEFFAPVLEKRTLPDLPEARILSQESTPPPKNKTQELIDKL
jgi:diguanylate cyclase (GGDEF)-like protein